MSDETVLHFMERYGRALSEGDLVAITDSWEPPALVLADEATMPVDEAGEVQAFFSQAVEWYRAQGLMATRPTLGRVQRLGERLTAVDVAWSAVDADGVEKARERSHYILRRGADNRYRIKVALTVVEATT